MGKPSVHGEHLLSREVIGRIHTVLALGYLFLGLNCLLWAELLEHTAPSQGVLCRPKLALVSQTSCEHIY